MPNHDVEEAISMETNQITYGSAATHKQPAMPFIHDYVTAKRQRMRELCQREKDRKWAEKQIWNTKCLKNKATICSSAPPLKKKFNDSP